jgi:hypothetical protein
MELGLWRHLLRRLLLLLQCPSQNGFSHLALVDLANDRPDPPLSSSSPVGHTSVVDACTSVVSPLPSTPTGISCEGRLTGAHPNARVRKAGQAEP